MPAPDELDIAIRPVEAGITLDSSLLEAKRDVRAALRARRRDAFQSAPGAERGLLDHIARLPLPPPDSKPDGVTVSGFWPVGSEIDVRPVLLLLHGKGYRIALPEVVAPNAPLTFRQWAPGDDLVVGAFGWVPGPAAAILRPDVLLVPLVAFDRYGRRLGQGGGYYDRTLAALGDVAAIGVAFAAQEVDCVPTADHDSPLCGVLTEAGYIPAAISTERA